MKVLLDESIDVRLQRHMTGHDAFTVSFMGWKGLKNGALLARAAAEGFEALITTDQNLEHQQNPAALPLAVIVLDAASNAIDDLTPLIPSLLQVISTLQPRTLRHV